MKEYKADDYKQCITPYCMKIVDKKFDICHYCGGNDLYNLALFTSRIANQRFKTFIREIEEQKDKIRQETLNDIIGIINSIALKECGI